MMPFSSSSFFDWTHFLHFPLFAEDPFPWIALQRLKKYLSEQPLGVIRGEISPSAYLIHPELISIGEGTIVEPGAYIQGPCILGKECVVRHGAYIRGDLVAGDKCVIGHDTEIKHSILLNGAHAAHFAYVGDSILGNGVNLGAGVKCANFRLDGLPIPIHFENQKMATNMRKLGAMIGDRSQIGCNTVSNPGTLIGTDVKCYPCLNIEGVIPSQSVVKPFAKAIVTRNGSSRFKQGCGN